MELSTIFLLLAVLILVGIYLYSPFISRPRRMAEDAHEISSLMAERDRVINALQELDFDHQLGKIPGEDYPIQRAALLKKGADILRKLDELAPAFSSGQNVEARIEKEVAARRADSAAQKPQLDDDEVEEMIASRRQVRKEKSAGFCPKCGKPILVTDRFCPSCGKSLT